MTPWPGRISDSENRTPLIENKQNKNEQAGILHYTTEDNSRKRIQNRLIIKNLPRNTKIEISITSYFLLRDQIINEKNLNYD